MTIVLTACSYEDAQSEASTWLSASGDWSSLTGKGQLMGTLKNPTGNTVDFLLQDYNVEPVNKAAKKKLEFFETRNPNTSFISGLNVGYGDTDANEFDTVEDKNEKKKINKLLTMSLSTMNNPEDMHYWLIPTSKSAEKEIKAELKKHVLGTYVKDESVLNALNEIWKMHCGKSSAFDDYQPGDVGKTYAKSSLCHMVFGAPIKGAKPSDSKYVVKDDYVSLLDRGLICTNYILDTSDSIIDILKDIYTKKRVDNTKVKVLTPDQLNKLVDAAVKNSKTYSWTPDSSGKYNLPTKNSAGGDFFKTFKALTGFSTNDIKKTWKSFTEPYTQACTQVFNSISAIHESAIGGMYFIQKSENVAIPDFAIVTVNIQTIGSSMSNGLKAQDGGWFTVYGNKTKYSQIERQFCKQFSDNMREDQTTVSYKRAFVPGSSLNSISQKMDNCIAVSELKNPLLTALYSYSEVPTVVLYVDYATVFSKGEIHSVIRKTVEEFEFEQ